MREIVFVRHAESQANRDGVWNGRTDGPLSEEGQRTLKSLADRLTDRQFDRVISSPLQRTRATAEAFADDIEIDDRFIEIDLGIWEGRRLEEIQAEHAEELEKAIRDRDVPMGRTGETLNQAGLRAIEAVDELADSLEDGQTAAVVTHGGFLQAVLHRHLTGGGRRVHSFTLNTGITRLVFQFGRPRLAVFNDVGHLGPHSQLVQSHLDQGNPVLALIRHGRTKANVERIWAERARELTWDRTAEQVARNGVTPVDDLKEIRMGRWEGLTFEEINERWPGAMETIYRHGVDLKRGETGESWGELTARFASAIAGLELDDSEQTAVVAHGGAIRSYISSLTRTNDTYSESLATPVNTSVTHVAITERGPEILDYSVAAHLEALDVE